MAIITKVIIRKQYLDNDSEGFFQIFWMSNNGDVKSNCDATWEQVIAVSNVAMRAGLDATMKINLLDGGQVIIDTWE